MDITEKSKEYAKGVSLEALMSAIEKAYADGFNDGMDYQANKKVIDAETGVTYVDLGLPSGTLWASDYVRRDSKVIGFTYSEASKLSIPTWEQFMELHRKCFKNYNSKADLNGIKFTGINGNSIILRYVNVEQLETANKSFFFWLKDVSEGDRKKCACFFNDNQRKYMPYDNSLFMGLKVPVMLVKKL